MARHTVDLSWLAPQAAEIAEMLIANSTDGEIPIPFAKPCRVWSRPDKKTGYGGFYLGGMSVRAHRASYTVFVGLIPEGLVIDHLCRNTSCIEPSHLEPATDQVNVSRGVGCTATNARKTHCDKGHEFTPENTRLRGEWRICRTCATAYSRIHEATRAKRFWPYRARDRRKKRHAS